MDDRESMGEIANTATCEEIWGRECGKIKKIGYMGHFFAGTLRLAAGQTTGRPRHRTAHKFLPCCEPSIVLPGLAITGGL
jgi:hypothetical protein